MRLIKVRLDEPILRRWHLELLSQLRNLSGCDVQLDWIPKVIDARWRRLERVMALERWLNRLDRGALEPVPPELVESHMAAGDRGPADVIVDLTDAPVPGNGVMAVRYDMLHGFDALVTALRGNHLPVVSIVDGSGRTLAAGRPGTEQPGMLATSLSDITAGIRALVVGTVEAKQFSLPLIEEPADVEPPPLLMHAARQVLGSLRYRLYRALFRAPHWRVGWRFIAGTPLAVSDRDLAGWTDLPDDGWHFYADPFPFASDGNIYLFVEDFDHRRGKGVISVVEYERSGPVGMPRTVLEHDVHLSYPFVLEHDGEIWMIPETSGARTIELYRALDFPDSWTLETILVDGVEASDATPFVHDGRWWMSATVRDGGSFSDALHLWSAPDLRGPWTAHAHNPVLIDIASARPGGRVVASKGSLFRPTQDGRGGYGAAMTIAEIVRLDDDHFEQRVVRRIGPSQDWPGRRLHTLNEDGGLEVIDGSRLSPRFW